MGDDERTVSQGRVRLWHDEDGWGVIDCDDTPGGCWCHVSDVLADRYRLLAPGQAVSLTFEPADQDGYSYRALEVWPADQERPAPRAVERGPSAGFASSLRLQFDGTTPTQDT